MKHKTASGVTIYLSDKWYTKIYKRLKFIFFSKPGDFLFTNVFEIKTEESTFKIDVGKGVEYKTYSEMQNLTEEEIEYITKKCTNLTSIPDNLFWDTSECSTLKSLKDMNSKQIKFCYDNNLVETYPLIGEAAIINNNDIKHFEKF